MLRGGLNRVCSSHLLRVLENVFCPRVVSAGKSQFRVNIREIQPHLCQFTVINIDTSIAAVNLRMGESRQPRACRDDAVPFEPRWTPSVLALAMVTLPVL